MGLLVRTCSTDRLNVSRLIARVLIVIGGLVWAFMFFAQATAQSYSSLTYSFSEVAEAGVNALIPLLITVIVFALAMYYEQVAAAVMFAAAAGVVVWGVVVGWEAVMWLTVLAVLAFPMILSASLLLLASSTQRVCELESVH